VPPPTLALLRSSGLGDVVEREVVLLELAGSTTTWICFSSPPQALTSATPGPNAAAGLMTQSWSVRSSAEALPSSVTR
jgi:hypothetical protein